MAFEPLTLSGAATRKKAPPGRQPNFPGFKDRLMRVMSRLGRKAGTFAALISLQWLASLATTFLAIVIWQQQWPDVASVGLAIIVIAAGGALLLGLLAASGAAAGFKAGLREALTIGFAHLAGFIGVAATCLLATGAAAVALLIPGFIILLRSALVLPALLAEDLRGTDLLSRSYGLVRGRTVALGLELFVLLVWSASLVAVIDLAADALTGPAPTEAALQIAGVGLPWTAVAAAAQILAALVGLTFAVAYLQIYYEDAVEIVNKRAEDPISRLYGWLAASGAALLIIMLAVPLIIANLPDLATPASPVANPPAQPQKTVDPAEERDWERYRAMNVLRIGLNSYQGSEKKYPALLEDLVGRQIEKLPTDPATGQPYLYELIAGGYRVHFTLEKGILALAPGEHVLSARGFDIPLQVQSASVAPPADEPEATAAAGKDSDYDGLTDVEEKEWGTDPLNPDTDRDGLKDGKEVYVYLTNPLKWDTDGDGFGDGDEVLSGFDPLSKTGKLPDQDRDGLADLYEIDNYLDFRNPDMDGDGLSDGDEVRIYGTDPKNADTDGDGFNDSEVLREYNPLGEGLLSPAEKQTIAQHTAKYGLHPPVAK